MKKYELIYAGDTYGIIPVRRDSAETVSNNLHCNPINTTPLMRKPHLIASLRSLADELEKTLDATQS